LLAADQARHSDPTLAARYYRLMVENGKHHTSAVCSIAAVLLTRIAACLRKGELYDLRGSDDNPISAQQGRANVKELYTVPEDVRIGRRSVHRSGPHHQTETARGTGGGTNQGVARRSKVSSTRNQLAPAERLWPSNDSPHPPLSMSSPPLALIRRCS